MIVLTCEGRVYLQMSCLSKRARIVIRLCIEDEESPFAYFLMTLFWIAAFCLGMLGLWVIGWITAQLLSITVTYNLEYGLIGFCVAFFPSLIAGIITVIYRNLAEAREFCCAMIVAITGLVCLFLLGLIISVLVNEHIMPISVESDWGNATTTCNSFRSAPVHCGGLGFLTVLIFVAIGLCFYLLCDWLREDWNKRIKQADHFIV